MPANAKPKEKARALAWLHKGKRAKWAAEKVGVHPTTVQRWAADAGIKLEYPYNAHQDRTDLVDKDEIIRLRNLRMKYEGHRGRKVDKPMFSYNEIAEMMGCSHSYIKIVCTAARKEGKLEWTRHSSKP